MKLLKYILKHKIISCIIILSIIFIPIFLIHFLFSIYPTNNLWIAKWTAGELLDYFGSILGAVATIIAVIITIAYTKHSQDEQNILQVKPYLQSKYIGVSSLTELSKKELDNFFYIAIRHGLTEFGYDISDIIDEINDNLDLWNKFYKDNCVLKYTVKNAGANTATNIKLNIENRLINREFALSKDESSNFIIIVNKSVLQNNKFLLNLEFKYSDVLCLAEYSQKELIKIINLDSGIYSTQNRCDMLSTPKRIK